MHFIGQAFLLVELGGALRIKCTSNWEDLKLAENIPSVVALRRFVRAWLDGVLESPNSLGQTLPELRQLLRAEQKQCDCQNHQQMPWLEYAFDHRFPSLEKTGRSARIFPELTPLIIK